MKRTALMLSVLLTVFSAAAQGVEGHPWQGRRVAYLGDSLTDPNNDASEMKYWSFLKEWLGVTPLVYGRSGRQWNDIPRQGNNLKADHGYDFDAILIFCGTNDYNHNVSLGEWFTVSDAAVEYAEGKPKTLVNRRRRFPLFSDSTFLGRVNIALDSLKRMFPDKQIVILTPLHRAGFFPSQTNWQPAEDYANSRGLFINDYVEALKEAGEIWSVPVIDCFALSGLYPMHEAQQRYFHNAADRLHPNDEGHRRLAATLYYQLLTLPAVFGQ